MKKILNSLVLLILFLLPRSLLSALKPWQGSWQGKCQMQNNQGQETLFAATLKLTHSSNQQMNWHLQYQGQGVRAYTLKKSLVDNSSSLEYLLDENNGILIQQTLFPLTQSFKALFEINNFLISVSYQLFDAPTKHLIVNIDTYSTLTPLTSSDGRGNNVSSFRPLATQNCRFNSL